MKTPIAGADGWTDADVPAWYDRDCSNDGPISFDEAIRPLQRDTAPVPLPARTATTSG